MDRAKRNRPCHRPLADHGVRWELSSRSDGPKAISDVLVGRQVGDEVLQRRIRVRSARA